MRRVMKLPMIGLRQSDSQDQLIRIVSYLRAALVRMANGLHSINAIPVDDCSQMAAAAGISCYSIRQGGGRPH